MKRPFILLGAHACMGFQVAMSDACSPRRPAHACVPCKSLTPFVLWLAVMIVTRNAPARKGWKSCPSTRALHSAAEELGNVHVTFADRATCYDIVRAHILIVSLRSIEDLERRMDGPQKSGIVDYAAQAKPTSERHVILPHRMDGAALEASSASV